MKKSKQPVHVDSRNVKVSISKPSSSNKRVVSWIIALLLFYVFTSAHVSTGIGEITNYVKQPTTVRTPVVVEKVIQTTKYREEKVPFGTPACETKTYNYTYTYQYNEQIVNNSRQATCSYFVTNQEDINGNFTFFVQLFKNGNVHDQSEQRKLITAGATARYEWNFTLMPGDVASCLLQANNPPTRVKCFYLKDAAQQIKEVPYTVSEKKNITEYQDSTQTQTTVVKTNGTINIYTNRFFGYRQPFYFGY